MPCPSTLALGLRGPVGRQARDGAGPGRHRPGTGCPGGRDGRVAGLGAHVLRRACSPPGSPCAPPTPATGRPAGVDLDPLRTGVATAVLVGSSLHDAPRRAAAERGRDRGRPCAGSLVTAALGAVFLPTRASSTPGSTSASSSHAYGSIFFLMTGFHGLHVLGGIGLMLAVTAVGTGRVRGPVRRAPDHGRVLLALRRRRVGRHVRHDLPGRLMRRLVVLPAPGRRGGRPSPSWARAGAGAAQRTDPYGYVVDVDALADPAVIAAGRELFLHRLRRAATAPTGEGLVGPGHPRTPARPAPTSSSRPGACRMADAEGQAVRKEPAYDRRRDRGPGGVRRLPRRRARPSPTIDLAVGRPPARRRALPANCAACHQAAGAGGALSYGRNAAAPAGRHRRADRRGHPHRARARCRCSARPSSATRRSSRVVRLRAATSRRPTTPAASRSGASARSPRGSWPSGSASALPAWPPS